MWKTSFLAACNLLAFVLSASIASAQTRVYHCVTYVTQGTKDVRYSSGPVRTDAPVSSLNTAWTKEVVSTYHIGDLHARNVCTALNGIPDRQENAVNSLEENWKRLGAEVNHVNWTSAPGQVAEVASPPPALTHTATATTAPTALPANSTTTHSLVQTEQQTAQTVPLAQDPRLAQIAPRIRTMMISDATSYETMCEGGRVPGAKSACECAARYILNYRITHANEYHIVYYDADLVGHVDGWQPRSTSLIEEAKHGCAQ